MSAGGDAFARALEGEKLTEAEITQIWAEAPVMKVEPEAFAYMLAALDRDPRVVPELLELAKRVEDRKRA